MGRLIETDLHIHVMLLWSELSSPQIHPWWPQGIWRAFWLVCGNDDVTSWWDTCSYKRCSNACSLYHTRTQGAVYRTKDPPQQLKWQHRDPGLHHLPCCGRIHFCRSVPSGLCCLSMAAPPAYHTCKESRVSPSIAWSSPWRFWSLTITEF